MGIKVFKKNIFDITNPVPITTITDSIATSTGLEFVPLMRNRSNDSGWSTTDSTDSGNTTIEIDFVDVREFDRILVVGHNLKTFTIKYWDGASWVNFSNTISETTNTSTTNFYQFTKVFSSGVQIIITGTQTANEDKFIKQLIITEAVGEFISQPYIKPIIDRDRKTTKFLSGKSFVSKSKGGVSFSLSIDSVSNENDLSLAETIFNSYDGNLIWLSGGDISQYETQRTTYKLEDIYLMLCANEYQPEWVGGFYKNGMDIDLKLVETN